MKVNDRGTPRERFATKYTVQEDGCWTWTAALSGYGYGYFRAGTGRSTKAHRFAYEEFVGEIPEGFQLDHLCRNTLCVNPEHLEPVTNAENQARGLNGALKRFCANGHEWTPENIYKRPNGDSYCRPCHSKQARRRYYQERRTRDGK